MLILCIGPDTFRALEKARELEQAFCAKFDTAGTSVERLGSGSTVVDQIIERVNTLSLFTPRRFIRVADLVKTCPKAKQPALVRALLQDPENAIVVSVEAEVPNEVAMKAFAEVPKFVRYDFPIQVGSGFSTWVVTIAEKLGVKDKNAARQIAEVAEGDSWLAWNELLKLAAGGTS